MTASVSVPVLWILSLPFRNLYIKSVHEVNASPSASNFQLIAFSTSVDSPNVQGGSAIAIYHSEINAYLTFDPVTPSKGLLEAQEAQAIGSRQSCNALWVIQAEKSEFGGEDVLRPGVESNEIQRKRLPSRARMFW